jgi:hypothetical protein
MSDYFTDNADSDSPFVTAYNDARKFVTGYAALDVYSIEMLDEFASCANYLLTIPVYENDAELIAFRDVLCETITRRQDVRI